MLWLMVRRTNMADRPIRDGVGAMAAAINQREVPLAIHESQWDLAMVASCYRREAEEER